MLWLWLGWGDYRPTGPGWALNPPARGASASPLTSWSHLIPSPSADPQSILEIGAEHWALVGDAAALADPITGEGIHAALLSATVLAETLREQGSAAGCPERRGRRRDGGRGSTAL